MRKFFFFAHAVLVLFQQIFLSHGLLPNLPWNSAANAKVDVSVPQTSASFSNNNIGANVDINDKRFPSFNYPPGKRETVSGGQAFVNVNGGSPNIPIPPSFYASVNIKDVPYGFSTTSGQNSQFVRNNELPNLQQPVSAQALPQLNLDNFLKLLEETLASQKTNSEPKKTNTNTGEDTAKRQSQIGINGDAFVNKQYDSSSPLECRKIFSKTLFDILFNSFEFRFYYGPGAEKSILISVCKRGIENSLKNIPKDIRDFIIQDLIKFILGSKSDTTTQIYAYVFAEIITTNLIKYNLINLALDCGQQAFSIGVNICIALSLQIVLGFQPAITNNQNSNIDISMTTTKSNIQKNDSFTTQGSDKSTTQNSDGGSSTTQNSGSSTTQNSGSSTTQNSGSSTTQNSDGGSSTTQNSDSGSSTTQNNDGGSSTTQNSGDGSSTTQNSDGGSSTTQNSDGGSSTTQNSDSGSSTTQNSGSSTTQNSGSSTTQDSDTLTVSTTVESSTYFSTSSSDQDSTSATNADQDSTTTSNSTSSSSDSTASSTSDQSAATDKDSWTTTSYNTDSTDSTKTATTSSYQDSSTSETTKNTGTTTNSCRGGSATSVTTEASNSTSSSNKQSTKSDNPPKKAEIFFSLSKDIQAQIKALLKTIMRFYSACAE